MRLLSLFSGIGAFEKALENIGIDYDLVNYCEIDKYASKSYSLIHNVPESKNLGDIKTVDTSGIHDIDMITYGFPCVDISLSGRMRGFEHEGEQTRSGLFFEALRIIEDTKPSYAICENVKNLVSKRFTNEFNIVLSSLEEAGYNNYWKVLNAKDFGVPQNRERVFIVSIRKDIDKGNYQFPRHKTLNLRVKDLMEDIVEESFYLKEKDVQRFIFEPKVNGCCNQVGYLNRPSIHDFSNRVYSTDGIARTLMGGGGNCNDKAGQYLVPTLIGGIGEKNFGRQYRQGNRVYDSNAIAMCLTSQPVGNAGGNSYLYAIGDSKFRIRKLTPKECFRLMGFDDRDLDLLVKNRISNTQLYKMAGNSIVVDVLEAIFEMLLREV